MTWQRRHPSKIDRKLWMYWLNQMPEPSPYLLPEWPLFWEQVWPGSRAEIWLAGDLERADGGVPMIRRRRFGMEWLSSQPMGTVGGLIGAQPGTSADGLPIVFEASWENFLSTITAPRTVEIALSTLGALPPGPGWTACPGDIAGWVLDLRNSSETTVLAGTSESHRSGIADGLSRNPVIERVVDAAAVCAFQAEWETRPKPASRIVLHHKHGPLFASTFAPAGALRWYVSRVNRRPVVTMAWLVFKQHAVCVDSAMDRGVDCPGLTHALFAHVLQDLHKEGVRHFDFGGSPVNGSTAGTGEFAEGWGARSIPRAEVLYRRNSYHRFRRLVP